MKSNAHEFSRPLQVDRVPTLGSHERIAADEKECAALAKRLGLPKLHSLGGLLKAAPWRGGGLKITGTLDAEVDQVSVISLETFTATLEYPIERYFLPPRAGAPAEEEDVDIIEHGVVDLGEILAETIALELDPYPRKEGEAFHDIEDQPEPAKVSPFASLSKFKPAK
jgi:Large ribosomal RNA subunit accumulation protein YceD